MIHIKTSIPLLNLFHFKPVGYLNQLDSFTFKFLKFYIKPRSLLFLEKKVQQENNYQQMIAHKLLKKKNYWS